MYLYGLFHFHVGQATSENKYENGVQELFQSINTDDIFDD